MILDGGKAMIVRKRLERSRLAIGLLLLGSYVGCFPDFDGLSSGGDGEGSSGAGMGGAMTGGAGTYGATGGGSGTGGEGGEGTGIGGTGTGGVQTGGKGGAGKGGKGGADTGGTGGSDGGTGDEGGDAGTSTGGTGMAGVGGNSGATAGGGAGAGGAGAGGAGGQAGGCTEGMGNVTATGVEKLTVPLMAIGEGQRFNVQNRTSPSTPYDLSGATVTIRAYAPCAVGGNLSLFFRSTSVADSPTMKVALSTLVGGFVDIPVPVPAATGTFDPVLVDVIRIEVEADAAYGNTFQSPATVVYIDSVVSSNGAVMQPFDNLPPATDFMSSGARPLAGFAYLWLAQYP
jgi:hypothetical protein